MNRAYNILFVDDEMEVLQSIRRILHNQETLWKIDFATEIDAAIQYINNEQYDVVVTDMKFPKKDGFSLISYLTSQEKTKDVQIIVLTGLGENRLKQRVLDLGVVDLLSKPINPQELRARIRSALRVKNYQDQLKYQKILLEKEVQKQTLEIQLSQFETIMRLAMVSEFYEVQTGRHIIRVAAISKLLAELLGFSAQAIEHIYLASPLHDIGKICIPRKILLKTSPLTLEEWQTIQTHSIHGYRILSKNETYVDEYLSELPFINRINQKTKPDNPLLSLAAQIALTHHENWDGSGYPNHLKGEEIPIESRIVSIADSYDALRSHRPYKPAYNEINSMEYLMRETEKKYDPDILKVFYENRKRFDGIFLKTNNGLTS